MSGSNMVTSFNSQFIGSKLRENAVAARQAAANAEKAKTAADLKVSEMGKLNIAQLQSAQTGTFIDNINLGKANTLTPARLACVQYMDVLREMVRLGGQAGSATETAASRANIQITWNGLLSRLNDIVVGAVNQATGTQILNGGVINSAPTAAAAIAAVIANAAPGAAPVSMTARNAAEANMALQALGNNITFTPADRLALDAIAAKVASSTNTPAEFFAQAFGQMSAIQLDSQVYSTMTSNFAQATQLGRLMQGAANTILTDAAAAAAAGTGAQAFTALVASFLGEAVPAGSVGTAVAAPAGAALARSQAFARLLSDSDKAALRAAVATGGIFDKATALAAAGLPQVQEMYQFLTCIPCFATAFRADPAAAGAGRIDDPANVNGFLGNTGAAVAVAPATVFLTATAAANPLLRINISAATAAQQINAVGTASTVAISARANIPIQMKNIGTGNMKDLLGANLVDTTGAAGTAAATAANNALAQLTAVIASFNSQVATLDALNRNLQETKDSYDSTASDITKADSANTGSFLAALQRANKMLITLLIIENNTLAKQEQAAEQVSAAG